MARTSPVNLEDKLGVKYHEYFNMRKDTHEHNYSTYTRNIAPLFFCNIPIISLIECIFGIFSLDLCAYMAMRCMLHVYSGSEKKLFK